VLAVLIVMLGLQPMWMSRWVETTSVTLMANYPAQRAIVPDAPPIHPS
jgi:NADH:ubiquinone oxidoreductase subunit 4 (subunit M)